MRCVVGGRENEREPSDGALVGVGVGCGVGALEGVPVGLRVGKIAKLAKFLQNFAIFWWARSRLYRNQILQVLVFTCKDRRRYSRERVESNSIKKRITRTPYFEPRQGVR